MSSIHASAVPEASGADRTLTGHATMVLARVRWSGHAPMRSCLHGLRAGGPGRDKSKQGQDLEGSVSQIVGHRPGRHFPIITGPSNRHNHYQRKLVSKTLNISIPRPQAVDRHRLLPVRTGVADRRPGPFVAPNCLPHQRVPPTRAPVSADATHPGHRPAARDWFRTAPPFRSPALSSAAVRFRACPTGAAPPCDTASLLLPRRYSFHSDSKKHPHPPHPERRDDSKVFLGGCV